LLALPSTVDDLTGHRRQLIREKQGGRSKPWPGLTAAKLRAAVDAESARLETLGYSVKSLYVDDGKTAEAVLTDALTNSTYDCIMIGAGLRVVPPYFLLFEVINVVHQLAQLRRSYVSTRTPQTRPKL
jgi:hypothetical protein